MYINSLKSCVMKSSFYFRFPELIKTDTKLKNCPSTMEQIANILELAKTLQQIRVVCGFPVIVNSAFRTPEVNSLVQGMPNSKHMEGLAADLSASPLDFPILCEVCKSFRDLNLLSEFKLYTNYIHIAI